jgi:dihydroorotate dehydrogenase
LKLYPLLKPLLFALPPEAAHRAAMHALRLGRPFLKAPTATRDPRLTVKVLGLTFPNPVGLGAGFDKYAECVDVWPRLGFGFVEIGTITRHAQPGNPKPRAFRYPSSRALINRFGFNNLGAEATAAKLKALRDAGRWPSVPVGINLGKSKVTPIEEAEEDYVHSARLLRGHADYIAVNVSSPNTPGLRSLQGSASIRRLVKALRAECKVGRKKLPLLVKFSPDMAPKELLASCDAAMNAGADGLILTNTTLSRQGLPPGAKDEAGGLSGEPVRRLADQCLEKVSKHTRGRVPLIGVGGIFSAEDARRKMDLGANLVQIYTGFIYQGPGFVKDICGALPFNHA